MFLWYSNSTNITGTALAEKLGIPSGVTPPSDETTIISWGARVKNKGSLDLENPSLRILNNPLKIERTVKKIEVLKELKAEGYSVPQVWEYSELEEMFPEIPYPLIARKNKHFQGRDAIICLQWSDVRRAMEEGSKYFLEYIPTLEEYRIHIFDGSVLRINKKVPSEEGVQSYWIRSHSNGWVFGGARNHNTYLFDAVNLAYSTLRKYGLDFGAVDILIGDDRKPYFLEINTGMGLDNRGIELYTQKFKEFLGV